MNSLELGKKVIKDKIPLISRNAGVYKMISSSGEILYIGKAKNIPNRLKIKILVFLPFLYSIFRYDKVSLS